eukprot:141136_1
MLYKKICLVSLTGYGLFTTHTFAGNYYFTATSGHTSCANATSNDTCNFDCNVAQWMQNFDCGQARQCNIYCSEQKCFESSTISASNVATNLNVYASGVENECYKSANFNLPNYGNATFSITGPGNNPFKSITINSGTNTNQIIIDCDGEDNKDDCKQITINAQTAQYLEINIGDAMLNGDSKTDDPAIINCPQNSNYNGPNSAPCYIKAESGSSIDFVTINTLYGIPMDVIIDGNNILYNDVTITGANIGCTDQTSVGFTPASSCWYTTTTVAPITTTVTPTTDVSTTTTAAPITTVAPTTDDPTTTTTTSTPSTTSSVSLSTTYTHPLTTVLATTLPAYSTTNTVLSSKNIYTSTLYVTDKYISTVSTIFSSSISSILLPVMSVVETVSQTDYSIVYKMESDHESHKFNTSIAAIILSLIAIIICLCCTVFIMFTRFRSRNNLEHNKDSQQAPTAVDEHQKNEIEDNKYIHEANNLPSLCMVVTQSGSMDMVNALEVNTADGYGENGSGDTPIEIEIEGNITLVNVNSKNKFMQNNDDIEIIFEEDEDDDMDIIAGINTIKETPMGPPPNENNVEYSDNEAIEIALANFTTKH